LSFVIVFGLPSIGLSYLHDIGPEFGSLVQFTNCFFFQFHPSMLDFFGVALGLYFFLLYVGLSQSHDLACIFGMVA
jgi:hypothetical protein